MYGPTTAIAGTIISMNCTIVRGLRDVYIVTPFKNTVESSEITFNATLDNMGNYTCIANASEITVTSSHSLTVYGMCS